MNRGIRQHQEKCAAKRHHIRTCAYTSRYVGKTPGKLCSCMMCGNPRKWFHDVTLAEMKMDISFQEQLSSLAQN